jgi:uncharacterized membrane protein YedE/YeeE
MATPEDCPLVGDGESIMQSTLVDAAREILSDADLMASFWAGGYAELTRHAKAGTSQWVGSKMLALLGSALFGLGLYLIVRFGGTK